MLKECASNKVCSEGERACLLLPSFFTSLIPSSSDCAKTPGNFHLI
jgi:hypothetical protein